MAQFPQPVELVLLAGGVDKVRGELEKLAKKLNEFVSETNENFNKLRPFLHVASENQRRLDAADTALELCVRKSGIADVVRQPDLADVVRQPDLADVVRQDEIKALKAALEDVQRECWLYVDYAVSVKDTRLSRGLEAAGLNTHKKLAGADVPDATAKIKKQAADLGYKDFEFDEDDMKKIKNWAQQSGK